MLTQGDAVEAQVRVDTSMSLVQTDPEHVEKFGRPEESPIEWVRKTLTGLGIAEA